jgi:O-antigen ligase
MIGRDPLREVYPFVYSRDDARNFLHSFLGNPEYFGGYSAAIAAAGAALVLYGRHLGDRAVGAIVSAIMGVCVVLSGTRAALLVLAAVILLLLAARWASLTQLIRRRILMVGAATATIGLIGVVILSTENPLNPRGMRLAQRFASLGDPNSASVKERILFYAIAAETVVRNPILGSGPGTYQLEFYPRLLDMDERDERGVIARLMYDLRNRVAENAHSDWLQAWSEGGAIGGAAFALLGAALLGGFFCWARDPGWYCRIEATEIPKIGESGQVTSPSVQESANLGGLTSEAGVVAAGFAGAFCLYLNSAFSFPLQMSARAGLFYAMVGLYLAAATHRR